MRRFRVVPLFLAVALFVATTTAGAAELPQGGGANNVVLAQTTSDGATLVRSATQVAIAGGPSVTNANIATALASTCTGCASTAVAVQVVLTSGVPTYFAPANVATAVNAGCQSCTSFAYAWQWVPQVSRAVTLSPEARQRIAELRGEIDATASSIVPRDLESALALTAALDALTSELRSVIEAELATAGAHATGEPFAHVELR